MFQQWKVQGSPIDAHVRKGSMELDWEHRISETPTLLRVIEELPKMASIVLQFTTRYRAASAPHDGSPPVSSQLPYALASYVRVRLQSVKNEATGQLQRTRGSPLPLMEEFQ